MPDTVVNLKKIKQVVHIVKLTFGSSAISDLCLFVFKQTL